MGYMISKIKHFNIEHVLTVSKIPVDGREEREWVPIVYKNAFYIGIVKKVDFNPIENKSYLDIWLFSRKKQILQESTF